MVVVEVVSENHCVDWDVAVVSSVIPSKEVEVLVAVTNVVVDVVVIVRSTSV